MKLKRRDTFALSDRRTIAVMRASGATSYEAHSAMHGKYTLRQIAGLFSYLDREAGVVRSPRRPRVESDNDRPMGRDVTEPIRETAESARLISTIMAKIRRGYGADDVSDDDKYGTRPSRPEPGFRSSCAAQCMGVGR